MARVPDRVGAGVVWSRVGTLASPLVELPFGPRFLVEPEFEGKRIVERKSKCTTNVSDF